MKSDSLDAPAKRKQLPAALRLLTRPVPGYAFAVIAVALSCLLRVEPANFFGSRYPFITFYPVVMLTASLCGLGPGILATGLSALYVAIWIFPPVAQFKMSSAADAVGLVVFLSIGIFISAVAGLYRRAGARIVAYEREQARLSNQQRDHLQNVVAARTQYLERTVAEHKRTEKALRESEARFRTICEESPRGSFLRM